MIQVKFYQYTLNLKIVDYLLTKFFNNFVAKKEDNMKTITLPVLDELDKEQEELKFKAKMTQIQFNSLSLKLDESNLIEELKNLDYFKDFKKSNTCELKEVKKWIVNGWNTEYLLKINHQTLQDDALRNALHWAFPQSYYSVFAICVAFYKTAGFTEMSHKAVISKMGKLMSENKYPNSMSFYANGGINNIQFTNISRVELPSTIHFENKSEVIDTQICQFLKSTREMELEERKPQINLKTLIGTKKKNFNSQDWEKVSQNIGLTCIMNLLYRKRIKSNYRDIETYLSDDLDPKLVLEYLIKITSVINLVHESFIVKGCGKTQYKSLYENISDGCKSIVTNRENKIDSIV